MALNNYFQLSNGKKRPQPKMWLCKPNYSRIERMKEISQLKGNFKYDNLNQLTFTVPTEVFSNESFSQERNDLLDIIKNKYVIEFQYINFKDYYTIEEVRKISGDSDKIDITAKSIAHELNKKSVNEIKLLASSIKEIMELTLKSYAPLWSLGYVDAKIAEVKREIELQQSTVSGVVDTVNSLFDSVVVFDNVNKTISFYHKDNAGVNRGLRVRENSYLKSFEDSLVSEDVITRLYPVGKDGLSINSVNPAGTDYIEDFSYFIKPFQRDENKKVIQHSDYMSDELCHALLDYQDFYQSKVEIGKDITKRYSDLIKEWSSEDLKLREYKSLVEQLEDRVELLKPKNEYKEYGYITNNMSFALEKSSYYLLMVKNEGALARVKVNGVNHDINPNTWEYIKIDTEDFVDALKSKEKAIVNMEVVSVSPMLNVTITRSSKEDYENMERDKLEKKYNYIKYRELYNSQFVIANAINKKLELIQEEKAQLVNSLRPENYLSPTLYNERELYVYSGVWQEENHTDAQELYDDAIKQLGQKNNSSRSVSIDIVNFTQSLEHEEDWDKLNTGEILVFSNKVFEEKLKAYITDMSIDFENNDVQVTVSDVFDYKDINQRISETLATATSSATQINFQKEQIRKAKNDISKIMNIIEGNIDARKQIITAGGDTIELNSKGLMNMEVGNREAYIIQNNGTISATRNNGNSHLVLADTKGLNAEAIKGNITLNNDARIRNSDGSIYIDDEGIIVARDKFKIVDKDGLDELEKIRKEQEEKIKELFKIYDQKINQLTDESVDVQEVVDNTSNTLVEAFKDKFITEFEKRKIEEHLAQLEKENGEYVNQIELALKHPYITGEDYIQLQQEYINYNGMYETLVTSIVESIKDNKITDDESNTVNESIVAFREEVKEILILVQDILETTRNIQIDSKTQKVIDFATRVQEDLQDEMADLEKSFTDLTQGINSAIEDGVFSISEKEAIKNNLLVMTSENRDITNRQNSLSSNPNLPLVNKTSLNEAYKKYNDSFNIFVNQINSMMEDDKATEEEIQAYKTNFETMTQARKEYLTAYDGSLLIIASAYAENAKSVALGAVEALKQEYTNDLQDLEQSITNYKQDITQAFSDGVITSTEKGRLKTHKEIITREKQDLDKNYTDLYNHSLLQQSNKDELNNVKTIFDNAFKNLNAKIDEVISDGAITELENNQTIQALNSYDIAFTNYSNAIQKAINSLSNSIADKVSSDKINSFSGVITSIQGDITNLQKQVDGAIDTWYYNYTPTLSNYPASTWTTTDMKNSHVGDFFLNNKTGEAYRFTLNNTTFAWTLLTDQAVVDALRNASKAQDTADGKRRVFTNTPYPPYDVGDMWVQGTNGDIMVCQTAKTSTQIYSAIDWQKASKYTDDTVAKQALAEAQEAKSNLSTFTTEITKSFQDGIITESEMTRLKTHLEIIAKDYTDLTTNVKDLVAIQDLSSALKSSLQAVEGRYKSAYETLKNHITTAISDKKITSLENENASTYLNNYATALSNLTLEIQKCLTDISNNQAMKESKKAIDNLEIGGRNLIYSEALATNGTTVTGNTKSLTVGAWAYKMLDNSWVVEKLEPNSTYTISYDYTLLYKPTTRIISSILGRVYLYSPTDASKRVVMADVDQSKYATMNVGDKNHVISTFTTPNDLSDSYVIFYNTYHQDENGVRDYAKVVFENIMLVKGNKSTGYSQAPEDIYAEIANSNKNLNDYKQYIETSFKDGILTDSEYVRLKTISDEIDKDKLDLTTNVTDLNNNVGLSSSLKTTLLSLQSAYISAHKTLQDNMASVISDKKITPQENTLITGNLASYNTALSNLNTHIQKCLSDIADTLAKGRSTEAVNGLEIGGRNLIPNSNDFKAWKTYSGAKFVFVENQTVEEWNTSNATLVNTSGADYGTHTLKLYHDYIGGVAGEIYTVSIYIKNNNGNLRTLEIRGLDLLTGGIPTLTIEPNSSKRYVVMGKRNSSYNTIQTRILAQTVSTYTNMVLYGFKIEKGNKATDYTVAPEDLDSQFATLTKETGDLKTAVSSLQGTINAGFADGIVTQAEAKAINQSKLQLEKEKKDLDGQYNGIYNSADLTDEAIKIELKTAKDNYDISYRILVDSITSAISDGKATPQESATITSNFADYSNKIGLLSEKLTLAYDRLSLVRAEKIRIGGKNILNNSDFSLGSKNWSTNGTATFEVVDGYSVAKITNLTKTGIYQTGFPLEDDFYVLSFKAKAVGTSSRLRIGLLNQPAGKSAELNLTSTWQTYTIPFTARAIGSNKVFHIYSTSEAQQGFYITQVQLEKGNKPTDWSPSLADVDEKTTTAITNATNTATTTWNKKLNDELSALKNPDSFPASAIKVDALLTDKLMSQALLAEKLVANNAFVNNLMANSIVTQKIQTTDLDLERLRTNVNKLSQSISIQSEGVVTSSNGETLSVLNQHGHSFYRNSKPVGIIGTGVLQNYPDVQGLRLSLNTEGSYVAFSYQNSAEQDTANTAMIWNKASNGIFRKGFMFFDDILIDKSRVLETAYIRPENHNTTKNRIALQYANLNGTEGVGLHYYSQSGSGVFLSDNKVSIIPVKSATDPVYPTEFGVDGYGAYVSSSAIHNRRYSSYVGNVIINNNSILGLPTSSKRYKDFIENQKPTLNEQLKHSKKVLELDLKTWYDKQVLEDYAREIETGEKNENDVQKLERSFGLIAEDVHDLGMEELVIYDKEGRVDALHYEKIALHLIPLVKDLYSKIEKLEAQSNGTTT